MIGSATFLAIFLCPSPGSAGLVRSVEPITGGTVPATTAAPRQITALPTSGDIAVDGRFDEPCWQTGVWVDRLILVDGSGRPGQAQTVFKVRFDPENLYIAVRAAEPNMEHLKGSEGATHDSQALNDDCIEVWLDPDGIARRAYHQVYSVAGGTYDEIQTEEWRPQLPGEAVEAGRSTDEAWDASGEVRFARSEEHWTCEMRLPVSDYGLDRIVPGSTWRFSLARRRWVLPEVGMPETSSLTGVSRWPLSALAELCLGAPAVEVAGLDFGGAGLGDNELRLTCRDPRGRLPVVDVRLTVGGDETRSYRHSIRLNGAESTSGVIPYQLRSPGEYALWLELLRPGTQDVLFRRTLHRDVSSALRLWARSQVAYRGKPWPLDVQLLLGGVSQKRARARVELVAANGRVVAKQTIGDVQPRFRLQLNLRRARIESEYTVRLTVVDDGDDLGSSSVPVRAARSPR